MTNHLETNLHPDLSKYVVVSNGVKKLQHPFVSAAFYDEFLNDQYNQEYSKKTSLADSYLKDKKWEDYISLFDINSKVNAFYEISDRMPNKDYWKIVGKLLREDLIKDDSLAEDIILSNKDNKVHMMNELEYKFYSNLPDEFIIYRPNCNVPFSVWTLSYTNAYDISYSSHRDKASVVKGRIPKKYLFAFINKKEELKCIVDPDKVRNMHHFSPYPEKLYAFEEKSVKEKIKKNREFYSQFAKNLQSSLKIDWNVCCLHRMYKDADLDVCRAFAYLYQHKNLKEVGIKLALSNTQMKLLEIAISECEYGTITSDLTLGVCWDAYRLESKNFMKTPEFSTRYARKKLFNV